MFNRLASLLLTLCLVLPQAAFCQWPPVQYGTLSGRVAANIEHMPIRDAIVIAHGQRGDDVRARTNQKGEYSLRLPVGLYDIFVSSSSFDPTCKRVEILENDSLTYNPELQVSSIGQEQSQSTKK